MNNEDFNNLINNNQTISTPNTKEKNNILYIIIIGVLFLGLIGTIIYFCIINKSENKCDNKKTNNIVQVQQPELKGEDRTKDTLLEPVSTSDDLSANLSLAEYVLDADNKLTIISNNYNNIYIKATLYITLYNESGEVIDEIQEWVNASPNRQFIIEPFLYNAPDRISKISVRYEAKELNNKYTSYLDYSNKIKFYVEDDGEKLVINSYNDSDKDIDYINMYIVYYKDKKIVGKRNLYSTENQILIGNKIRFFASYPRDKDGYNIEFDDYKLIINSVSVEE